MDYIGFVVVVCIDKAILLFSQYFEGNIREKGQKNDKKGIYTNDRLREVPNHLLNA